MGPKAKATGTKSQISRPSPSATPSGQIAPSIPFSLGSLVQLGDSDGYWKVLFSGPVYHSPNIHLGLERCVDAKHPTIDIPRLNCTVPADLSDGEFQGVRYFSGTPQSCVLVPLVSPPDPKHVSTPTASPVVSSSRSLLQTIRDRTEGGDFSRSWCDSKATQTDPFPLTASVAQQRHAAVNTELVVVETLPNGAIEDGSIIAKERLSAVEEFHRVFSGLVRSFTFLELPNVSDLHRFPEKMDSIDAHVQSLSGSVRPDSTTSTQLITGLSDWAQNFLENWNKKFPNPANDRENWIGPKLASLRTSNVKLTSNSDSPTEKSVTDADELEEAAKRLFFHSEELTTQIQGHSDDGSVEICELLMKEKVSTLTETQKLLGDFLTHLQSIQRQASIPWDNGRTTIEESMGEVRVLIERYGEEMATNEDRAQLLREAFEALRLKTSATSLKFSAQLDATRQSITDTERTWRDVWDTIASLLSEARSACLRHVASFEQAVDLVVRREAMLDVATAEEEALQVEYASCVQRSRDLNGMIDDLKSALCKGPVEVSLVALVEEAEKRKMDQQRKLFDSGLKLGVLHESVCRELCFTLHDLRWKKNWVAQSLESKLALPEGPLRLSPEERASIRHLKDNLTAECAELDREMHTAQQVFDRLSKPLLKQTNRFRGEIQQALIEKEEAKQLKLLQITEELHSSTPVTASAQ